LAGVLSESHYGRIHLPFVMPVAADSLYEARDDFLRLTLALDQHSGIGLAGEQCRGHPGVLDQIGANTSAAGDPSALFRAGPLTVERALDAEPERSDDFLPPACLELAFRVAGFLVTI
jgi:hypothetical protein